MLPAGFGKGTLKLSDKYKLITRQLLYASLWSQFGWMKSNSLRLFYSSLYYFHSKLITIYGSICTTHGSFYKIWLHKNSKTWLIDHVKFDITHSKNLLPSIFFTLSFNSSSLSLVVWSFVIFISSWRILGNIFIFWYYYIAIKNCRNLFLFIKLKEC